MATDDCAPSYDDIAQGYDELHGSEQKAKAAIIAERLHTTSKDRILDIGCGTGIGSSMLQGIKTGIDLSVKLLRMCPFKAVLGKAEKLPFADKSFDVAVCISAAHNFDDVEKALAEMARVTKRQVAITILRKSKKAQEIERLVKKYFDVQEIIDEQHDRIIIAGVRS